MNRDKVIANGPIAKSGTSEFLRSLTGDQRNDRPDPRRSSCRTGWCRPPAGEDDSGLRIANEPLPGHLRRQPPQVRAQHGIPGRL
jgi:hypothetical protein